jgi:hypothetical protein
MLVNKWLPSVVKQSLALLIPDFLYMNVCIEQQFSCIVGVINVVGWLSWCLKVNNSCLSDYMSILRPVCLSLVLRVRQHN